MALFRVKGVKRDTNEPANIKVEAADAAAAQARAERHGYTVESVTAVNPSTVPTSPPPMLQDRPTVAPQVAFAYQAPASAAANSTHLVGAHSLGTSGWGVASLVMGIVGCLVSWIPCLGIVGLPVIGIGLVLGLVGLIVSLTGKRSGVGMPAAGLGTNALALAMFVLVTAVLSKATSDAAKQAEAARAAQAAITARYDEQARSRPAPSPLPSPGLPTSRRSTATPAAANNALPEMKVSLVKIEAEEFGRHRLTLRFTNVTGKSIRAIKGSVSFEDQFGDRMGTFALAVAIDDAVAAGETHDVSGVWPMLDDRVAKLLSSKPSDVTIKWKTDKVAFDP